MIRAPVCLLFPALLVLAVAVPAAAPAQQPATLGVMTFNLRFASDTPPNAWPDRRPVMAELIRRWSPDLIGTQEGVYHQLEELADDLPEYRWIGLGREGGSRGEFMAVYYRPDRLTPLEYDHFWLSDTPELIGSATWGNQVRRMVTWVRFREHRTGREFVFINTHFDHQVQAARERSAELVAQRAARWGAEVPVLLVGDFNAEALTNPVYHHLTRQGGFTDSWVAAGNPEGLGTFHGFAGEESARGKPRIDWILTRGPVTTLSTEIITYPGTGQLPSDHYPVFARVRIGG
jgi:endonuclease/exonuclease/phosphatase family metal-dependent hydrolase